MVNRRPVLSAAGAAVLAGGTLLGAATPATALSGGTVGQRETVCAQDLAVRTDPGGAWLGTLFQGQTFLVERLSGGWAFGFAYGHINHRGWVQDGWFC